MQTSTGQVSIDEFKKIEMRVGTIVEATRVPRTEKLFKVVVDMGDVGRKQTITSLVGYYKEDELLNKKIIFLANLKETKFAGQRSEGMLLAAVQDDKLALLTLDREVPNGSRVS